MLYVSSQICHGRLIIFQPGADTDVWHDVFFNLFGPVDGWFLTGPNSKLERVSASWQQITFGTECWIFFRGKRFGKSPVFWLGYAFLFGEADGGTLQIICMCFLDSFGPVDGGFLTGPKIKIEKKPFFLKDRAQYCTMNIILHAHLHRTRTTHIIFKLVLQSR